MTSQLIDWTADSVPDPESLRQAKQRLTDAGLLALPATLPGVPGVIERSWRRCVSESVPIQRTEPPYREDFDPSTRLLDAAAPVINRIAEQLGDMPVAMFLTDATGHIVLRKATEPRQRAMLDNAYAAEGFYFSESAVGTNALGTVVEERRPVVVRGCEHYNEALEQLTCAGTPIFQPFTRKLVGTFSLASPAKDATPLMCAVTNDIGKQIESNLTERMRTRERALINSYLLADQNSGVPVIVLNERTAFANTAGLPYLSATTHALLWRHVREHGATGRRRMSVPLEKGWYPAHVERIDDSGGTWPAYCVRLACREAEVDAAPRRRVMVRPREGAREPLHPLAQITRQLEEVAQHREALALDGGPGTGKLHTALTFLRTCFEVSDPLVIDFSTVRLGNDQHWFQSARSAAKTGRGLVLRHVDQTTTADARQITALAEQTRPTPSGGATAPPLVLTVDLNGAADHVHALVARLATAVRLPALPEMPQEIPALVKRMLAEVPGACRSTTFSSEALQLLLNWTWPGNLAELRQLVNQLSQRKAGRVVLPADLPDRMHARPGRRMSLMESAERDTIVEALRRCGGNRSQAAQALGIGRTTLYRKIRHYRIDI